MTMHYTPSEEAYVAARAAFIAQQQSLSEPKPEPQVMEVPDINEAERIWKLLVDSANS
jgi:hypothetical protein